MELLRVCLLVTCGEEHLFFLLMPRSSRGFTVSAIVEASYSRDMLYKQVCLNSLYPTSTLAGISSSRFEAKQLVLITSSRIREQASSQ